MTAHSLSKRMIAFRERNGISQGELGRKLNVSAQAVSRWEHGGMPDVALLPKIAEILGCSVDDLYASSNAAPKSMEDLLTAELQNTPSKLRFQRSIQLAWHIMKLNGSTVLGSNTDTIFAAATSCEDADQNLPKNHNNYPTDCFFNLPDGLMYASVSTQFKYTLFMQEPDSGFSSILNSIADYQQLFALFCKENCLAVYLLGLFLPQEMQFTIDYVCKKLNLPQNEAQAALDMLCEYGLLNYNSIQSADCFVDAYSVPASASIIPFLYFGKHLMRNKDHSMLCAKIREKPLFPETAVTMTSEAVWTPVNSKPHSAYDPPKT